MIIDNTVEIDSPIYADTEYHSNDELIVYLRNSTSCFIVYGVSEREFLKLQKDPSHEAITELMERKHRDFHSSL